MSDRDGNGRAGPAPAAARGGDQPDLLVEERGRVLVLTMNRPRSRNAVSMAMAEQIAAALDLLDRRDDLSVAVITGAGGTFCAGMDLNAFGRGERAVVEDRGFAGIAERPPDKPLIAAVEGWALAGGFEVVLACDLVVASEGAAFGLPEVKRGLTAAAGGLLRLQHRIPYHLAMELVLTGRVWSAPEAAAVHLVNRLVPAGTTLQAAMELAEEVAQNAPLALTASKQVLVRSVDWPLEQRFDRQQEYVDPVRRSTDAQEGALAFVEKRPPRWTGR
jgi:enoyl-CoA hydratase